MAMEDLTQTLRDHCYGKAVEARRTWYSPTAEAYAPGLNRTYEDLDTQLAILDQLGQMAIASGFFKEAIFGWQRVEVTYSVTQYLQLLSTYSPYLRLEPQPRQRLFDHLRQMLERQGDCVELSYVSAFHVAQPRASAGR